MECAEVPVKTNFADTVPVADGIAWKNELMEQQRTAYAICEEKDPDRIIVLGGDCSVENREGGVCFQLRLPLDDKYFLGKRQFFRVACGTINV